MAPVTWRNSLDQESLILISHWNRTLRATSSTFHQELLSLAAASGRADTDEPVQHREIRSVIVRAIAAVRKFKLLNLCVPSADETEANPACKATGCCSEGSVACQKNLRQFQNIDSLGLS